MSHPTLQKFIFVLGILLFCSLLYLANWATSGKFDKWFDPTPILSLVGFIVGFSVISWQLEQQHRNTLEANRRQAQNKLKLDIYKEIASRIEATSQPLAELEIIPLLLLVHLRRVRSFDRNTVPASVYSFQYLSDAHTIVSDTVIRLMSVLELYEIVMPEFKVFREKLSGQLNTLRNGFFEFNREAPLYLKTDTWGPIKWPPTDSQIEELDSLGKKVSAPCYDITGIIFDLRVAAQNYLLGELFPGKKATQRKPGDPSVEIVKIQQTEEQ